jgi:hypothetical protein
MSMVPEKVSPAQAALAGACRNGLKFTDTEVLGCLATLNVVVAYFVGRGDAGFLLGKLRADRDLFETFAYNRGLIRS